MTANDYYQQIVDTLQGRTPELQGTRSQSLDWAGAGALLELLRTTSGSDRTSLIQAIGKVLQDQAAPTAVLAQLVQIVSSLDLAEIEPAVRCLQGKPVAFEEPLQDALTNYFAFRRLKTSDRNSTVTSSVTERGQPNGSLKASQPSPRQARRKPARRKR